MTDKFTGYGFADYFMEQKRHINTFLDKIDKLIDWKPIEKLLKQRYKRLSSADGRPAYPPLPMFKLLLLQRWYNLSDPKMEEALNDRISFIRFSGFSIMSPLPDHSTICRFRNTLLKLNICNNPTSCPKISYLIILHSYAAKFMYRKSQKNEKNGFFYEKRKKRFLKFLII